MPSRQAPRGVLSSIWLSGIVGAIFLLAVTLSFKDIAAAIAAGQAFGFPIATTIKENLTFALGGITLGELYLFVILDRGLRLHAGDPGRDGPADVLDGPRPATAARRAVGPASTDASSTPANASLAVGVLAAIPILRDRCRRRRSTLSIAATGMIYLSYFLCNLGVLVAGGAAGRTRGVVQPRAAGARSSTSSRSSGAA